MTLIKGKLLHGYQRTESLASLHLSNSSVSTCQYSQGNLSLNDKGRSIKGVGRTAQKYKFVNGRGETYERDVEIFNITNVLHDKVSGSLAPPAPDVKSVSRIGSSYNSYHHGFEDAPVRTIHGQCALTDAPSTDATPD